MHVGEYFGVFGDADASRADLAWSAQGYNADIRAGNSGCQSRRSTHYRQCVDVQQHGTRGGNRNGKLTFFWIIVIERKACASRFVDGVVE